MMTSIRHITIIIITVLLFGKTYAQDTLMIDFLDQIKTYDLSIVLSPDSISTEDKTDGKGKIKRPEILGFIGDDYQRFFIHFISIFKSPSNPNEYLVKGKTKVKESTCSFKGKIRIREAFIYKIGDFPTYKQGIVTCDVMLFEDKKQPSTGFIKGILKSEFLIDNKGKVRYHALMFDGDSFSNNQFFGKWTSYKTNISKKCNWGDYRIPSSYDLDQGVGEFIVNDKYLKNGWENYRLAWGTYPETVEVKQARKEEDEEWWK